MGEIGKLAQELEANCRRWDSDLQALKNTRPDSGSQNLNDAVHIISQVKEQVARLANKVEANTKAITDERIPASLKRFDGWFQLFLRSQNLRWLLVEFLAPLIYAGYALYVLM